MKTLRFTLITLFSLLLFTLSHALHLQPPDDLLLRDDLTSTVDLKPDHHDQSPSDGSDAKILLPTQKPVSDETAAVVEEERDVDIIPGSVPGSGGFTEVDIQDLVNRRPVHLKNRFPFPRVLRFFPRRCNHRHKHLHRRDHQHQEERFFQFDHPERRFEGRPREMEQDVVGLMFRKNEGAPYAEIVRHHHVVRPREEDVVQEGGGRVGEFEPMMILSEFKRTHPRPHPLIPSRHQPRRDHGRVRSGEGGGDLEEEREKEKRHHRRHHHRRHHEEEEAEEEERENGNRNGNGNGLMKKIRKFLMHI